MSFNLTNRVASPALDGQDSLIQLSWSDANGNGTLVYVGEQAGVVSSGKLGTVTFVDPKGIYIKVKPAQPNAMFDSSSTPGQLAVNESITFF